MHATNKTSRQMIALALASTAMGVPAAAWAQAGSPEVTFEEREIVQEIPGAPVTAVEIEIEQEEMGSADTGDYPLETMDNSQHHPMRHHAKGHGQRAPAVYPGAAYPGGIYPGHAMGAPIYFPQGGFPAGAMSYPGGFQQDGLARDEWLAECRARYEGGESRGKNRGRTLGALLGAAAGGLAGNRIAGRGDRLAGTLVGAGVGALAGGAAGSAIGASSDRRQAMDECEAFQVEHEARWQHMSYGYGPVMLVPIMVPVEQRAVVREYVTEEWVDETVMVTVPGKKIIQVAPAPKPVKTVPMKTKTVKSVKGS